MPSSHPSPSRSSSSLQSFGVVACTLCAVTLASSTPARAAGGSLALMPLRVENLALNEGAALENNLRDLAASKGGYQVQPQTQTTKLVEASQSLGITCDPTEAECASKLGALANAQFLLVAHAAGNLDGSIGVDVRVFDVAAHAQVRRASALLPSDPDGLRSGLDAYATTLFSSAPLGAVTFEIDPPGATVTVDGTVRGTSPLPGPVDGLVPGDHFVVVEKPGFLSHRAHVAAQPGQALAPTTIALAVDPTTVHTVAASNTAPLVAAGLGAGLVVIGAVTAGVAYAQYSAYVDGTGKLSNIDKTKPAPGGYTQDQITAATNANIEATAGKTAWDSWGEIAFVAGLVGAGVGAVVAGVGGYFALASDEPVTPSKPTAAAPSAAPGASTAPAASH